MIRILMILLLTGCSSLPTCGKYSNDIEKRDSCRAQQESHQRYQERMRIYDRFDRR